jgi:chromosomal replication initiation ATPase DnaA
MSITKETILNAAAAAFGVSVKEITGRRRHAGVVAARHAAVHAMLVRANLGQQAVAKLFRASPSWPSYAMWKCEDRAETDRTYSAKCSRMHIAIGGAA